jgi:hypothetical protein
MIASGEHKEPDLPGRATEPSPVPSENPDILHPEGGLPEEVPRKHSRTCGAFSILDICEAAHRDTRQRRLCLRDEDVRLDEIHRHLLLCPICARWYRNAARAYEPEAWEPAAAGNGLPPYQPRERAPVAWRRAGKATDLWQQLDPAGPDAEGLDRCTVVLEWSPEPWGAGQTRWWLALHLHPEGVPGLGTGNSPALLRQFEGFSLRLERRLRGEQVEQIVTRLDSDSQGGLVTVARCVGGGPQETQGVKLIPLEKARDVVGD